MTDIPTAVITEQDDGDFHVSIARQDSTGTRFTTGHVVAPQHLDAELQRLEDTGYTVVLP